MLYLSRASLLCRSTISHISCLFNASFSLPLIFLIPALNAPSAMQSDMIHASQPTHQLDMVPDGWDDKRVLAQLQSQQPPGQHQHDGQQCKHHCERRSPRRYLISALALLFSLTALSVILLFFGDWSSGGSWAEAGTEGAGSWFIKRATQAAGSTSEDSPFIKNKRRCLFVDIIAAHKLTQRPL